MKRNLKIVPKEPTPMPAIWLRFLHLACGLANAEYPPRTFGPDGRPVTFALTPTRLQFFRACPWGKTELDATCFHCQHHVERPLLQRSIPEAEADTLQEASPEEWRSPYPVPVAPEEGVSR